MRFTCAMCGQTFETDHDDARANEEFRANVELLKKQVPNLTDDDVEKGGPVCGECFKKCQAFYAARGIHIEGGK